MIDCIVTYKKVKGKIHAVMIDKHHNGPQLLSAEFKSIAQLKRVCKDAKIQYCSPKTFNIAKNWIK